LDSAHKKEKTIMAQSLTDPKVDTLVALVEEATRSSDEGVRFFVEPAKGTLSRCLTKRHHIIFGRRGSGKTSLLRKAASDLTISRRPIAFVDLEEFKGHSYPDVLISVLLKSLRKFKDWLDTAAVFPATKTTWWDKLFRARPNVPALNRAESARLHDADAKKIDELVDLKFLHRINSRVTVRNRPGRIFNAFMLDLSQYVGARKQRNLELLEFWRAERVDDLRKAGLIFLERLWQG
jgi:hypothetical protein